MDLYVYLIVCSLHCDLPCTYHLHTFVAICMYYFIAYKYCKQVLRNRQHNNGSKMVEASHHFYLEVEGMRCPVGSLETF